MTIPCFDQADVVVRHLPIVGNARSELQWKKQTTTHYRQIVIKNKYKKNAEENSAISEFVA